MDVWIARQPILDRKQQLYGYELLFRRDSNSDRFDGTDAEMATSQVLAHTLLAIGLDNVLSGRKAFINLDRALLLGTLHSILPREDIVLEVLEDVVADPEVVAACRSLQKRGYTIALDDFVRRPETEPLTEFARIIKVDVQATPMAEQERILHTYKSRGIALLAEKIETNEEFLQALGAGYHYFQGYFFGRPAITPGRQIPPLKTTCLGLLSETQCPELNLNRIAAVIEGDVALSWQLLRYVNSALFGFRKGGIRSIHQALTLLGENYIRNWAALATLPMLAKGKAGEVVTLALVRAHFSERLGKLAKIPNSQDAFLMGLFSLLDALVDLPLEEALKLANVSSGISAALLGKAPADDFLQAIHRLVTVWESGDWAAVSRLAILSRIPASSIGEAYIESMLWAGKTQRGTAIRKYSRRSARQPRVATLTLSWRGVKDAERTLNVRLLNIAAEGLGLDSPEPVPLNSPVSIDAPDLRISGRGTVRYCLPSGGRNLIGIEFSDDAAAADREESDCERRSGMSRRSDRR